MISTLQTRIFTFFIYQCTFHDCIVMDMAQESNDACVPYEVDYTSAVFASGDFSDNCINFNSDSVCAQYACVVEGNFIQRLFNFFSQGVDGSSISATTDNSLLHANGFDNSKAGSCPLQKGVQNPERSCCGTYPIRYPYKPLSGDRACCGQRTFLTAMYECCDELNSRFDFSCL